jgi:hypothetical protein
MGGILTPFERVKVSVTAGMVFSLKGLCEHGFDRLAAHSRNYFPTECNSRGTSIEPLRDVRTSRQMMPVAEHCGVR